MGACASVNIDGTKAFAHAILFANGPEQHQGDGGYPVVTEFDSVDSFDGAMVHPSCGQSTAGPEEPLFVHEPACIRLGGDVEGLASSPDSRGSVTLSPTPVDPEYPNLFRLNRDGYLVQTSSLGAIQFGIPPESIKDCMNYGLEVPTFYVIFGEMFDRNCGLSTAEFEFPIYFNYFVKKRKVTILTTSSLESRIRTAFQETLFGPAQENLRFDSDFAPSQMRKSFWPNFEGEGIGLDGARKTLTLEDLLEFIPFHEFQENMLNDNIAIKLAKESNMKGSYESFFRVYESGECIARIPAKLTISVPQHPRLAKNVYRPPMFGVTVLGSSHGFDPKGNTTGFVLWINRAGIMVDPPPNSSQLMERIGVSPSAIEGIILTHCHADHDAGTFQKILRQRQVRLYTTTTIKESFMRKYAAITGFSVEFLSTLFEFKEVVIGSPLRIGCAMIKFFYALHTIPCIGFQASWNSLSIAYSADTNYSPSLIEQLHHDGVIGLERKQQLLQFPWDSTVVLHEMGVPPIHTPSLEIEAKCKEDATLADRLFIVHTAPNSSLKFKQLKEIDTISLPVQRCKHCEEREILRNLKAQYFFRHIWKHPKLLKELASLGEIQSVGPDTTIISSDESADFFYIVMSGAARVSVPASDEVVAKSFSGEAHMALAAASAAQAPRLLHDSERCLGNQISASSKLLLSVSDCFGEEGITLLLEEKLRLKSSFKSKPRGSSAAYLVESSSQSTEKAAPTRRASRFSGLPFAQASKLAKPSTSQNTYGFSVTSETDLCIVKFPIDGVVSALLASRSGTLVCDSLLLSSQEATVEALHVISSNSSLYEILVDQMCIEEFLKLLHKKPFAKDDILPEPAIIIEGSVTATNQEASGGTFRGISHTTIDFQPKSGLGKGVFLGNMNNIAKGNASTLEIRAENDGYYYKIAQTDFANFLKQFPGFLVQVLDTLYIRAS
ncbi:cGMP-dependent 3',5'-cGMP phosphodiesterase A [Hondaea fermentalgiana]|uniref:cGMP-dependent 3',5'-cGMP phosphodiesterase A n=1 Tax=Hondaea fermentalgiana TaxID=2315210 RepID=A0A2R5GQS6_9STRA|nr:cGMP-dependent 3',5'-cGMP phosphodiesterase A [Hondaea fermentalgiana]|eukprot:GBG33232.1 cGMP-dependent 3',5'-cGMP phosphodiesterase A [Hondaea fermentalgiana]